MPLMGEKKKLSKKAKGWLIAGIAVSAIALFYVGICGTIQKHRHLTYSSQSVVFVNAVKSFRYVLVLDFFGALRYCRDTFRKKMA